MTHDAATPLTGAGHEVVVSDLYAMGSDPVAGALPQGQPVEFERDHACAESRTTGVTAYLKNGGALEPAAQMAIHTSARTTQLYDRRAAAATLDEVGRIGV